MKLYQEGDKSKAICQTCADLVETTFLRRDVPFSDGVGLARGILVAVCDRCHEVVGIPAQSTPAIREARKPASHSIEAKLPSVFIDALDLACFELSPEASTEWRKRLVTFYIHKYASGELTSTELSSLLGRAQEAFPRSRGSSVKRLSLKVSPPMADEVSQLLKVTRLSQTNLLKSIVYKIKEDVVDRKSKAIIPELKSLVFGF
ncbi:hypothetical protein [Rhodocyclus purpureus]|uniref:hypothetical protein n=1 Tax=Rhodocyclus purpureus TaxID=1067 RepID=UPI001911B47C|nr:hypothetical protein [Rhodocyclus purpureus]